MANTKNKKIKEAGRTGTVAEFWNWVAALAHAVWEYAHDKETAANIRQSELLNEIYSIEKLMEPGET
jgi:hypothetical protein